MTVVRLKQVPWKNGHESSEEQQQERKSWTDKTSIQVEKGMETLG